MTILERIIVLKLRSSEQHEECINLDSLPSPVPACFPKSSAVLTCYGKEYRWRNEVFRLLATDPDRSEVWWVFNSFKILPLVPSKNFS